MWHALLLISFLVFWFLAQLVALWKDIIFFFFLFYLYRCGSFSLWSLLLLLLPLSVSVLVNILHEGREWRRWSTDNCDNTAGQGIGKVFVITAASLRVQPSFLSPWCEGCFTGKMSASQWQKCHIDDIKSVQNLVRNSHWSKYYFYSFCYCLRITDKTQKITKVKCKYDKSTTKQSKFLE